MIQLAADRFDEGGFAHAKALNGHRLGGNEGHLARPSERLILNLNVKVIVEVPAWECNRWATFGIAQVAVMRVATPSPMRRTMTTIGCIGDGVATYQSAQGQT